MSKLEATRVKDFPRHGYEVLVVCGCGHRRRITASALASILGGAFDFDAGGQRAFRDRLRCSACGAKAPPIAVGLPEPWWPRNEPTREREE